MPKELNTIMADIANPAGAGTGALNHVEGRSFWHDPFGGYATPSAAETSNGFVGTGLDPEGLVSGFYNDVMGFTSQSREFEQQQYMQDRQWAHDDPAAQMERLRKAGINLNTAAAGVAGGNVSAAAPSVGSASPSSLGAVSSALNAGSQAKLNGSIMESNRAKAALDFANARNVDRLADADILSKAGSFAKALTESGTPEIAAMELGLSVVSGGLTGVAALLKGDSVCRFIESRQNTIEAEFSQRWSEIEKNGQEVRLLKGQISEQDYKTQIAEIEKKKQDLYLWREQQTNEMWTRFDGDPHLDIYQSMSNIRLMYGEDSPQYQALLKQAKDLVYNQELGRNSAEVITQYNKVFQTLKAQAEWQPYLDRLEEKKHQVLSLLELCYGMSDSAITNVVKAFLLGAGQLEDKSILTGEGVIPPVSKPIENGVNMSY